MGAAVVNQPRQLLSWGGDTTPAGYLGWTTSNCKFHPPTQSPMKINMIRHQSKGVYSVTDNFILESSKTTEKDE